MALQRIGVARIQIDLDEYRERLERYRGRFYAVLRSIMAKARSQPKRIVFPEGSEERVLRAVQIIRAEEIAEPVLLGNEVEIQAKAKELGVDLSGVPTIDPRTWRRRSTTKELINLRRRKGVTERDAERLLYRRSYFGVMMVRMGDADALEWAVKHREIIARFGRFPHRNAVLGRASTAEEEHFLTQPGSSF